MLCESDSMDLLTLLLSVFILCWLFCECFMFMPAGWKPRQRFDRFWKHTFLIRHMHIWRYVTGLGCVGSYVTGLAGGGDVDVHVNLRHMHIVRYVTGLGGLFCVKKRIRNKTILIHTGGVDAMWRISKSAIPCSLSTRSNGHINPKLMRSIRVWQWRWMNSKTKSLLELTGRALKNGMAM